MAIVFSRGAQRATTNERSSLPGQRSDTGINMQTQNFAQLRALVWPGEENRPVQRSIRKVSQG